MCVVSFVGEHYEDKFKNNPQIDLTNFFISPQVSREEFEALKKEVMEMKELLKKAKTYDERNNEPDCEIEDKIKVLKAVAKMVGVDLNDVFKK